MLTNVGVTVTSDGPGGSGDKCALAFDLTSGALVATCILIDTEEFQQRPKSVIYRPNFDDYLVLTGGSTQGGMMFRLNRDLGIINSTVLAIPALPATDLWATTLVRSDHQGGLYVCYSAAVGTAFGDQFIRKIDPVTFQPLVPDKIWRTFLPRDSRSPCYGDFSLDGTNFFFGMRGGPDLNQNVIYKLPMSSNSAAPWVTYGTYSGGTNATGNTYDTRLIRPKCGGGYIVATHKLNGTSGNILNEILIISEAGVVGSVFPVQNTTPSGTFMYAVSGMEVSNDGNTLWFVTDSGRLAKMNLITGIETLIKQYDDGSGSTATLSDLAIPTLAGNCPPPELSGIYYLKPSPINEIGVGTHDRYYEGTEKKIPNPTFKTPWVGE